MRSDVENVGSDYESIEVVHDGRNSETIVIPGLESAAPESRYRPIVLVDIDGVVANFLEASLVELRSVYDFRAEHDDVTGWDFEGIGLTYERRQWLSTRWLEPGFCSSIRPYPDAIEGIDALRKVATVYAVTAPMVSSRTWQWERARWLGDHFGFHHDEIISTSAKCLVRGDILVEDRHDTINAWCRKNPYGFGILWDRPYNRGADLESPRAWSSDSWEHVTRIAQSFSPTRTELAL